jgi:hypothetical protein
MQFFAMEKCTVDGRFLGEKGSGQDRLSVGDKYAIKVKHSTIV